MGNILQQSQEGTILEFVYQHLTWTDQLTLLNELTSWSNFAIYIVKDISIQFLRQKICISKHLKSRNRMLLWWSQRNFVNCGQFSTGYGISSVKNHHKGHLLRFLNHILCNYTIPYPTGMRELIIILLAIAPATGPLERAYSKLAKICYKHRKQLL